MGTLSSLKNVWYKYVIMFLIERVPGLKQFFALLDGKKAFIGRILMLVSVILAFFTSPDGFCKLFLDVCTAKPWIVEHAAKGMALVGWLLTELGLQHQEVKEKRAEGEPV